MARALQLKDPNIMEKKVGEGQNTMLLKKIIELSCSLQQAITFNDLLHIDGTIKSGGHLFPSRSCHIRD